MFKMNIRRPMAAMTALALLSVFGVPGIATAAGGNGLRVTPVRTDITINPGQSQTVNVTATNITATAANFQAVINDFTANTNESGDPAIILDPNKFAPSHSLKRFVKPIPSFALEPGQQKVVPVVISVPANAAGGGYYGAVRFAPAGADGKTNQNVTLAGSVGSLIIVRVPGDIKEQLNIASFDTRTNNSARSLFTTNKKIDAVVRFQNLGNIQEQPFGKILLKNRSGKILAEYEINNATPRGNVLPDSVRKFTTNLDKVGSFGMYKLEGNFGYGSNGQLLSASTTFYVIPLFLIVVFALLVLLILFVIFVLPRLVKRYNQRVLRQAGRR